METASSIHNYWFGIEKDDAVVVQQRSKTWWSKNEIVDAEIREKFEQPVQQAARHRLDDWASTPSGMLSLILLTDQFPRNMYRGTPSAFEFDTVALEWCLKGIANGFDLKLRPIERVFFYLPLEHAESRDHQEQSVQLFSRLFQEVPADLIETFRSFLAFSLRHRRVIERFGRFPHRNAILQRTSTADEIEFLKEPGSSF